MCGIAGAVNIQLPFQKIKSALLHRGPDAQQEFIHDNVHLIHLRLSILDVEGGAQPMHLNSRYSIIFNGQIYNHLDLRKRFHLEGETRSDTETLLLLYKKLGVNMLHHLDGMFAFAIYDRKEHEIFLARDRAGKKPLYIYDKGDQLVFASELNCLKSFLPLEMNGDIFSHYFRLGVFYRQFTPYRHVQEMLAGTWIRFNTITLKKEEHRWWNIHEQYCNKSHDTFSEALEKTETLIESSIHRRLTLSDVEVGSFLSGGIDSGLVVALAAPYKPQLKTFTVSFQGTYNEAPLARLVAERYNTNHAEIDISFDGLRNDIEQIIMNYGEPYFDSSAIPSYYVAREARKHVKVILNGDGADELFGGYRRYVPFSKMDFFKKNALITFGARALASLMPYPNDKKSRYNFIYRLLELSGKKGLEVYFSAGLDILEGFEHNLLLGEGEDMMSMRRDFNFISQANLSGLKKIMNLDFDTNLFSDLLVKMDIASMSNSLEGRSPFLSMELMNYIPGLSDDYKIKGASTKVLLRTIAKKYLPESIIHQPKRGFEVPLKDWVNGQLKEIIGDYLLSTNALSPALIQKEFITNLFDERVRIPAEKRAKILWMLFCLEVWYKRIYLA